MHGWPRISAISFPRIRADRLDGGAALAETILRWLSRSTNIVCSMRTDLSLRSVQLSVSTVD